MFQGQLYEISIKLDFSLFIILPFPCCCLHSDDQIRITSLCSCSSLWDGEESLLAITYSIPLLLTKIQSHGLLVLSGNSKNTVSQKVVTSSSKIQSFTCKKWMDIRLKLAVSATLMFSSFLLKTLWFEQLLKFCFSLLIQHRRLCLSS